MDFEKVAVAVSQEFTVSRLNPRRTELQLIKLQPVCAVCLTSQAALSRCSRCHSFYYCGTACQRKDWESVHKAECKETDPKKKRFQPILWVYKNPTRPHNWTPNPLDFFPDHPNTVVNRDLFFQLDRANACDTLTAVLLTLATQHQKKLSGR